MKTKVKELRTAAKLTQRQLAEFVGVSSRTIISIETGRCQSLSHAGIPDCQGVRRQRGRIVLSGREPDGGGWKKMKENCLMGKEYIELRSSLDALCRSFIENKETIRDTFPWDSVYLYPVCGAVFTDKRRRADGEQLKYCRDLLRDETGVFSSFRGLVRIAVISLLCAGGEIESRLKRTIQVYDALRKHFFSSQYLPVAAVMIADLVRPEKYDETAARVRHIYDLMKNEHPFLTSGEDSVFAAMLALSPMTDAEIVSETERCFELLKGEFFSSSAVQSLSHVLALGEGTPEEKCRKTMELFHGLKKKGCRYGTGYELATLGALALLPKEADSTVGELIEADHFLEKQKGYGVFGLGRKQRLMHAGMLLTSDYLGTDSSPVMNSAALSGVVSLVAAQQTAVCAAVAAAGTAAAASS